MQPGLGQLQRSLSRRDDFLVADLQEDDGVEVEELLAQHLIEGGGLGERARVAVHDETFRPIVAAEALGDHVVDEVVGDELARFDERLGALGRRACCWRIASRRMSPVPMCSSRLRSAEQLGLGALAAARRTEKDETHGGPVPPPLMLARTGGTLIAVVRRPRQQAPIPSSNHSRK